jgi:hypothetical protein
MMIKIRVLLLMLALLFVQVGCRMSASKGPVATQLPAPNQTITALFAITFPASATPTLPPVASATLPASAASTIKPPPVSSLPATATLRPPAITPTSTNTQPPQPSATIPSVRPRSAVVANYINIPLEIDGDWGEWKDITKEYPANPVVYGKSNWTNADDLSSSFHIGWDESFLYIAVKVHDDVYVQNASGAELYKGDSIELLLDTNLKDDFYYTQLSPDDFQLGISPGRPNPDGVRTAYLWLPRDISGPRTNVKIGSRLEDGVYRVEAAIPWNIFEITPVTGRHYGFALSVSDNDDGDNNVQQTMISNVATRHLTDPTTWGDLQLVKQ